MESNLFQLFEACDSLMQMGVSGAKKSLGKLFREGVCAPYFQVSISGCQMHSQEKDVCTSGVQGCGYSLYLPASLTKAASIPAKDGK